MITIEKKHEVWNHFVARWALDKREASPYMTGPKLRKIHSVIWTDRFFWSDMIVRHNMIYNTPEQLKDSDSFLYDHALGNFWGMVTNTGLDLGLRL